MQGYRVVIFCSFLFMLDAIFIYNAYYTKY